MWSTSSIRSLTSSEGSPGSLLGRHLTYRALKRLLDLVIAGVGLVLLSPVLAAVAALIRAVDGTPVLFHTPRVGQHGIVYTMHKFRTMQHAAGAGPRITGPTDRRVFPLGRTLRRSKIDELPQLWDVLRGQMSIVGPRPEDPVIVERHYDTAMRETLTVRPGLTSLGSIYGSIHPELLDGEDPERAYVERMLPIKLALERVYVRRQSFWYDLRILARTVVVVAQLSAGMDQIKDPPEIAEARRLLALADPAVQP